MENQSDKEFLQSLSELIPSVKLNKSCCSTFNPIVIVNFSLQEPIEYYAFIRCTGCGYESPGGGIRHDYFSAVLDAQNSWNESELDGLYDKKT